MDKIETIFDRGDNFKVTPKIRVGCEWVFSCEGIATEKLDGTNIRLTIEGGKVTSERSKRIHFSKNGGDSRHSGLKMSQ